MHFRLEVPLFIALMITWVSCQSCGNVQLSGNTGIFTTPGYPGKYDHKADCWWTITAPKGHFIHVTFKKFDIVNPFWTCSDDYVTVTYDETKSDDKFCNDHPPPEVIKSTTNMLKFHLESDRFMANGVGFEAKYDVVDKFGNKLAGDDEDEDDWDDDTGKKTGPTTSVSAGDKALNAISKDGDDGVPVVSEPAKKPKTRKGRKGRKGKKGKKTRKSKEERRRERKLRKQKAGGKKKRKGRKNRKVKRAPKAP